MLDGPYGACVSDTIVLAHAPLVGPSSWRWVAELLVDGDAEVVVPDLHRLTRGQLAPDFADALAAVIREHDSLVLVGHSGAGPLLPLAVEQAGSPSARYVFVDTAVPPPGSPLPASPAFREQLEALVEPDGLLPPWHTWWGPDGMAWLVPDEERRALVSADIPRLPLAYFDAEIVAPTGWQRRPGGFVLLSEAYRSFADTALEFGWPVVEVMGTHLELVNDPDAVAAAILSTIDRT